jgi:hypothetical protein
VALVCLVMLSGSLHLLPMPWWQTTGSVYTHVQTVVGKGARVLMLLCWFVLSLIQPAHGWKSSRLTASVVDELCVHMFAETCVVGWTLLMLCRL